MCIRSHPSTAGGPLAPVPLVGPQVEQQQVWQWLQAVLLPVAH